MSANRRKENELGVSAGGPHRKVWDCSARTREKKRGCLFTLWAHKEKGGFEAREHEKKERVRFALGENKKRDGLEALKQEKRRKVVGIIAAKEMGIIAARVEEKKRKGVYLQLENHRKEGWGVTVGAHKKGVRLKHENQGIE